ncbi:FixH family protein [Taylorella equigenitalis]|uniref:Analog of CcoH n=3 Tax=Taylorella equigenitalis TaxID=29575 RepID=A0A654KI79_TAYEM|nr:FixH family protein [Taylorella equigenitalis]ADU92099.1 Putative analog of CcoH [Taylorella equigenitalis MCE9]AFN35660.1 putative membrane protein [Taylorella equigenitalis ATCC 35865]ASY30310.1 CcoH-like protein [Taylorella equigenitalis]ASY37613.1 CcoH-like protein [Taylorella equigenitalis]ASY39082.1 CcoH-like protein [Taylorella equigenitalis]
MRKKTFEELDKKPNPWYKEPWPWILMAGPIMAVIGCIITINLALKDNYDDKNKVHAYKQGKFISRDGSDLPKTLLKKTDKKDFEIGTPSDEENSKTKESKSNSSK